jgi:hypothetical protein
MLEIEPILLQNRAFYDNFSTSPWKPLGFEPSKGGFCDKTLGSLLFGGIFNNG